MGETEMISQGWPLWAAERRTGKVYVVVGWEAGRTGLVMLPVVTEVGGSAPVTAVLWPSGSDKPLMICASERDARFLAGGGVPEFRLRAAVRDLRDRLLSIAARGEVPDSDLLAQQVLEVSTSVGEGVGDDH